MTEIELKDGWEVSDIEDLAFYFGKRDTSYEYKLIRRKKVEPMPEIFVGDAVYLNYARTWVVVTYVENSGTITGFNLKGEEFDFNTGSIEQISRGANTIWERKP